LNGSSNMIVLKIVLI